MSSDYMEKKSMKIVLCDKEHFRILKAVAILMVMLGHAGNNSGVTWFTPLGGIGVAIFLFCSGYGIAFSAVRHPGKAFWKNRFFAVYFEYGLIVLVAGIVQGWELTSIARYLVFVELPSAYFWYLRYLIVCYVIGWVLLRYVHSPRKQALVIAAIGCGSFLYFYGTNNNIYAEQTFAFGGGMLIASLMQQKGNQKERQLVYPGTFLLLIAVAALAAKQFSFFRVNHTEWMIPLNLVLKTCGAGGIILWSFLLSRWLCWLSPVGDISYSLYLVHAFTIPIVSECRCGSWIVSAIVFFTVTFVTAIIWHQAICFVKKLVFSRK